MTITTDFFTIFSLYSESLSKEYFAIYYDNVDKTLTCKPFNSFNDATNNYSVKYKDYKPE